MASHLLAKNHSAHSKTKSTRVLLVDTSVVKGSKHCQFIIIDITLQIYCIQNYLGLSTIIFLSRVLGKNCCDVVISALAQGGLSVSAGMFVSRPENLAVALKKYKR